VRDPWFRDVQALAATAAGALSQAEYLLEAGKADQAAKLLEGAAAANPGRADILRALAHARALGGQLPRARDDYLRALALEPKDARTHAEVASVLLDLGEMDDAARHAAEALAADASIESARIVMAQVRLKRGDAAGALADLAPLLAVHPDNLLAHVVRGDALLAAGRPEEAAGAFEAALRINPAFEYAKTRLAAARGARSRPGGR
jgi:tetratricopeptide (TPR) repeat protein